MASPVSRNRQIFRNFNASSTNFRTLLLIKTKVSNFIGKPLNLAPYSTDATIPLRPVRVGTRARGFLRYSVSKHGCSVGTTAFPTRKKPNGSRTLHCLKVIEGCFKTNE